MATSKSPFDINILVEHLRDAASQADARAQIKSILSETVTDPSWVAASIPVYEDDDVVLFEDDTVSIWHCRFKVGQNVPAHDHQMVATIAVYQGAEQNSMWVHNKQGSIEKKTEISVEPGNVLQFGPTAIHSVGCQSDVDSCAIHVYLGKLTTVERSLFDTKNNKAMPFDDENYDRLVSIQAQID